MHSGVWCSEAETVHEDMDRPMQWAIVDLLAVITVVAAVVGLWRYQCSVNPDPSGRAGVWLHIIRIAWNTVFVVTLALIVWVLPQLPIAVRSAAMVDLELAVDARHSVLRCDPVGHGPRQ